MIESFDANCWLKCLDFEPRALLPQARWAATAWSMGLIWQRFQGKIRDCKKSFEKVDLQHGKLASSKSPWMTTVGIFTCQIKTCALCRSCGTLDQKRFKVPVYMRHTEENGLFQNRRAGLFKSFWWRQVPSSFSLDFLFWNIDMFQPTPSIFFTDFQKWRWKKRSDNAFRDLAAPPRAQTFRILVKNVASLSHLMNPYELMKCYWNAYYTSLVSHYDVILNF